MYKYYIRASNLDRGCEVTIELYASEEKEALEEAKTLVKRDCYIVEKIEEVL